MNSCYIEKRRRNYDTTGHNGFPNGTNQRNNRNTDFDYDFASSFKFRTPEEVFREFFRGDPFADLFDLHFGHHAASRDNIHHHRHSHHGGPLQSIFTPFGFGSGLSLDLNGFGLTDDFDNWTAGANAGNIKKTSTSTRFVNGKKIVTKK